MNTLPQTPQSGFIALISILMLSAVLLATTISLAQFGIANRFFVLNLEQKAVSEKLAEACVHIARINAYNDPAYEVSTDITHTIAGGQCTIHRVETDGSQSIIEARAISGDSVTNVSVVVDTADGTFISWDELAEFPD